MSSAPKYIPHYTVADYMQWEGDWELWEGVPIAMTPSPFGPHQNCLSKVIRSLAEGIESAGCNASVLPEIDWIVTDDTVVRPDVTVICGEVPAGHVTKPPAIVAEILSPSTAQRDQNEKRRIYDEHGVRHYLIIDTEAKSVRCFSRDSTSLIAVESVAELTLAICDSCEITVDASKLF